MWKYIECATIIDDVQNRILRHPITYWRNNYTNTTTKMGSALERITINLKMCTLNFTQPDKTDLQNKNWNPLICYDLVIFLDGGFPTHSLTMKIRHLERGIRHL